MKKTWLIVVLAIVAGIGLGWGTTYARYGIKRPSEIFHVREVPGTGLPYAPAEGGPMPRIVVDQDEFNFGTIEVDSHVRHSFKISNFGSYPLVIESGGTSCGKCTFSDLEGERVIRPSQSTDVVVEYHGVTAIDHFRQGAVLITNDPERPRVTLAVTGKVRSSFSVMPSKLVLGQLSAGEERLVELRVLAYLIDDLQVSSPEFLNKNTAEFFEADFQPLPTDQLPADVKSGVLVKIHVKPGLPFGAVRQTIRLASNLEGQEQIEVPLDATVEGDISISGPRFDDKNRVLSLGAVSAENGSKNTVMVIVRGPHRQGVEFKVTSCDPPWLKAEVGTTVAPAGSSVARTPLTIEIPTGSPASVHMGNAQGKLGVVELESTHPHAKQLKIFVQFAVEP